MQDSEIYNQPQQVLYREQQHQFIENVIPRVQNNRKKAKLEPIQNINNSFIYQVELKNKVDCIICLQQMLEKSNKDPIVQLRCHTSHIFHKLCITEWLNQNKKCPICNKEFK
ncbi:unnamed protein product [Paramecium sonneborni]|nr:unnamed protein product [Paramecium sonneborni]